jgi:predicted permease
MNIFLFILTNNLIPIFTLIILGIFLGKKFSLDVGTLSKINLYAFVPLFIFVSIYTTEFRSDMIIAAAVVIVIMLINRLLGFLIGRTRKYDQSLTNAFTNSIMFYNSGNFGIPLITMVFSSKLFQVNGETPYLDYALTIQIIVLIIQNTTTNTIGVFNANRTGGSIKEALKKTLNMPSIYFVVLAFVLKLIPYNLEQLPVWSALTYVKEGLISLALISLGVQLSRTKIKLKDPDVSLSVFVRLIGGPVIAFALVSLLGIKGIMAQALIISSSVPTSVNTALIGVEFNNSPGFASRAVMVSTLLSSITLTAVIYAAGILFPV